jgi:Protein of unknown function (DUF1670)
MDAYGTARLAAKDAESAIVARICEDFNLTPVLARAHYEQMARYFADFGHMALNPGELVYLAVASDEPPGKPIIACRKVQVALELASGEDREVLRDNGLAAMRRQRLARLARQAQVQGGLLTVEDLAYLTCSSTATVKRDLAACRAKEVAVPTRGQIRDIGPGVSHKALVVQLYLWGCSSPRSNGAPVTPRMRSAATSPTSARSPRCTHGGRRSPRSGRRRAGRPG